MFPYLAIDPPSIMVHTRPLTHFANGGSLVDVPVAAMSGPVGGRKGGRGKTVPWTGSNGNWVVCIAHFFISFDCTQDKTRLDV